MQRLKRFSPLGKLAEIKHLKTCLQELKMKSFHLRARMYTVEGAMQNVLSHNLSH